MRVLKTTSALTSVMALLCLPGLSHAQGDEQGGFDKLSLGQLMDMEVTSVSKKSEKASEAAAAIFVITQEDIRRSGATSIPEALRGVPGLQVAQANSHVWAISSRGFNDHFANKLLVLIDGRSVYTPLFSGVYWDVQDTLMDDIDRIEVIRGPGATLWGANAVNGVINIITKKSEETTGGLVKVGAGNEERGFGALRYGGKLSDGAFGRAYFKYFNRDGYSNMNGNDAQDPWDMAQGGFRVDWDKSEQDNFTLQGDLYNGREDDIHTLPRLTAPFATVSVEGTQLSGANILGRWTRALSETSSLVVQTYIDHIVRNTSFLDEKRTTMDLDVQHSFNAGDRHEFVWGGGYRRVSDDLESTFAVSFTPEERTDNLFSAFIQDKIALYAKQLYLTLGSKFEHNDYTGFEYQPSARLSWLINDKQTLWTSVSRAIRTPNRASDDISLVANIIPGAFPTVIRQTGNDSADSEELVAYEIGYRIQPRSNLSFDFAAFYNDYDKLFSNIIGSPTVQATPVPHVVIPVYAGNDNSGKTYGIEVSSNWEVNEAWSLSASYSLLETNLELTSATQVTTEGNSPNQQVGMKSHLKLPHDIEISNSVHFTDMLEGEDVGDYVRMDARISWKPLENVEVSVVGQNLLDPQHQEFSPLIPTNASQVDRSLYANVSIKF